MVISNPPVQKEAKQIRHRRQPPRHARRLEAAAVKVGEVVPQRLGFDAGKAPPARSAKFGKSGKIPRIGSERVVACALLRREHVESHIDQLARWDLAATPTPPLAP